MITRNFKNCLALLLQTVKSTGDSKGLLPVVATNGNTYYVSSYYNQFPNANNTVHTLSTSITNAGIQIGDDETAARENDYATGRIISGVTGSITVQTGIDNGRPYIRFDVAVTNNNDSAITVKEITYNQKVACSNEISGIGSTARVVCFDRTVLGTPVEIGAGETKTIAYTLMTNIS